MHGPLRESQDHRRALALLAPSGPSPVEQVTEAVLLHAIFEAGLAAVRAQAEDEVKADIGAVSPRTMAAIEDGLRAALALS